MNLEVGDRFIINWKYIRKFYPKLEVCKDLNKEFTIVDFSKSGLSVYFNDGRTNKRGCRCQICLTKEYRKCIGVSSIILTLKRIQYDRDKKITNLLKNENKNEI